MHKHNSSEGSVLGDGLSYLSFDQSSLSFIARLAAMDVLVASEA